METQQDIYKYILNEESAYQTTPVSVVEGYEWSMYKHIKLSVLYKSSQFETPGEDRPFKNIIRPILNVGYRSEGFDVKDISLFINDYKNFYKSFLVKKFNERWCRVNDIDTLIDDIVESYIDFGGVLVKRINGQKPECVPLQKLAFCDQTDILSGPICEKHSYSPAQLIEMGGKWDVVKIEEAIVMAKSEKDNTKNTQKAKTPGKYIEVYELHGSLPESWLKDDGDPNKYVKQVQFVTFYTTTDNKKEGITLFKGPEKRDRYKFEARDKIFNRALGFGGIEELFESQVWTNYSEIQMKEMLDYATNIILQTESKEVVSRNPNINDLEKGTILDNGGKKIEQVITQPINFALFDNAVKEWELHARTTGSANDAQLGVSPSSGTPFALQNLITTTGQGMHQYRQGKLAKFFEKIYRDWILPDIIAEMKNGDKWLDDLSLEEMQYISEQISTGKSNRYAVSQIIAGKQPEQEEIDAYRLKLKKQWLNGGSKRFIEIIKGELDDSSMDISIDIAGKQKNLIKMTSDLSNIFRQVISNPAVLKIPSIAKIFNQILEYSGFSMVNFLDLEIPDNIQNQQSAGK
jgi:hypothetical protein